MRQIEIRREKHIQSNIPLRISELLPQDYFTSEKWHKPYAEALMEPNPVRLEAIIIEAESAISNRYLELCISPAPIECRRDLQNALSVLTKLRSSISSIPATMLDPFGRKRP